MLKSGCFCEPEQIMEKNDCGQKAIIISDDRFLMKLLRYALSSSEIEARCFSKWSPLRQEPEAPLNNATSRDCALALTRLASASKRFPPPAEPGDAKSRDRMNHCLPTIGEFDTIIVDYDTDGLSSPEFIQRLRALYPRAIIIVVSQWDVGIASLRAGANDFLRKPFVPYRLAMMIHGGDILS